MYTTRADSLLPASVMAVPAAVLHVPLGFSRFIPFPGLSPLSSALTQTLPRNPFRICTYIPRPDLRIPKDLPPLTTPLFPALTGTLHKCGKQTTYNSCRISTYEIRTRNSFTTLRLRAILARRIRTYKKPGGGGPRRASFFLVLDRTPVGAPTTSIPSFTSALFPVATGWGVQNRYLSSPHPSRVARLACGDSFLPHGSRTTEHTSPLRRAMFYIRHSTGRVSGQPRYMRRATANSGVIDPRAPRTYDFGNRPFLSGV